MLPYQTKLKTKSRSNRGKKRNFFGECLLFFVVYPFSPLATVSNSDLFVYKMKKKSFIKIFYLIFRKYRIF